MEKISGWKTKWGVVIGVIGGALLAGANVVPPGMIELVGWLQFFGTTLSFAGSGLAAVGIAHKGEKNAAAIVGAVGKGGNDAV